MRQAANTDLINSLVFEVHNSECFNLLLPVQMKPVKVSWILFVDFFAPSALMG